MTVNSFECLDGDVFLVKGETGKRKPYEISVKFNRDGSTKHGYRFHPNESYLEADDVPSEVMEVARRAWVERHK